MYRTLCVITLLSCFFSCGCSKPSLKSGKKPFQGLDANGNELDSNYENGAAAGLQMLRNIMGSPEGADNGSNVGEGSEGSGEGTDNAGGNGSGGAGSNGSAGVGNASSAGKKAGSNGSGNSGRLNRHKTEIKNINSVDDLLQPEVLLYMNAILTGKEDSRPPLIPNKDKFFGKNVVTRKYGTSGEDCVNSSGSWECQQGSQGKHGGMYYFQTAKGTGSDANVYTYTYDRYRANKVDFYITGEVKVTMRSSDTDLELKGQLRIHSEYNSNTFDNSSDNVIIVRFGDSNGNGHVKLDENNVAKEGNLTIRLTKSATADYTKTYNLDLNSRSSLSSQDKEQINGLGLFKVN